MSVTLHTSKGDIKVELHCEEVSRSAANFLALCASGKYDGTRFHRIVGGYIIQGGDPSGSGKVSRAGFGGRRLPDEGHESLNFAKEGVVAFANGGKMASNGVGSQFFITLCPAPHLDGSCTIVGRVIDGLDVAKRIGEGDVSVVEKVTIHANPFATGEVEFKVARVER